MSNFFQGVPLERKLMNYSDRTSESTTRQFDDVVIDVDARAVTVAGDDVHLTRTEFDLLMAFVRSPRQALSRTQIVSLIWGVAWYGDHHLVSVHVSNLRKKISDGKRKRPLIRTLHGFGYRFDGEAEHRASALAGAGAQVLN